MVVSSRRSVEPFVVFVVCHHVCRHRLRGRSLVVSRYRIVVVRKVVVVRDRWLNRRGVRLLVMVRSLSVYEAFSVLVVD